jgi:hypothetical protein
MSRVQVTAATTFLTALLIPMLAWTPGRQMVRVSGRQTMKMVQQRQVEIGGPAHVLLLTQGKGTNRSTGPRPWMNGAELISSGTADLVAGSGPQQGYNAEVWDGDTAYVRWQGKVTTTLTQGQPPATSFGGTWVKISGTGRLKGLGGSGTYQGRFTSPTDYVADWSGEVEVPPGYAAAR